MHTTPWKKSRQFRFSSFSMPGVGKRGGDTNKTILSESLPKTKELKECIYRKGENKRKGEKMELTYENMMRHTEEYFDILPSIDPKKDSKIVDKVKAYFSSDFIIRWGDPVKIHNREQWVDHLCGHANEYKAIVLYKPAPLCLMVDDRKKMAACFIKEEMRDSKTGDLLRVFFANVHYEFILENGTIKFKRELITRIPAIFQLDSLPK